MNELPFWLTQANLADLAARLPVIVEAAYWSNEDEDVPSETLCRIAVRVEDLWKIRFPDRHYDLPWQATVFYDRNGLEYSRHSGTWIEWTDGQEHENE